MNRRDLIKGLFTVPIIASAVPILATEPRVVMPRGKWINELSLHVPGPDFITTTHGNFRDPPEVRIGEPRPCTVTITDASGERFEFLLPNMPSVKT